MASKKSIPIYLILLVIFSGSTTDAKPISSHDPSLFGAQTRARFARTIAPILVAYGNASISSSKPQNPVILKDFLIDLASDYRLDELGCNECKDLMMAIDAMLMTDEMANEIMAAIAELCKILEVEDDRICDSVTKVFKAEVMAVLTMHYLSPDQVCGTLLGSSCATPYDYLADWNITFSGIPKPPVTPVEPPTPGAPRLRILHISDVHLDLLYKNGTNAWCGEPICCRSGKPPPHSHGAGLWGDRRGCDSPMNLLINIFEEISQNHKFDLIYMTGDLPPHDVWNQTREGNLNVFHIINDMLLEYFPGVKVYSALGNHESAPCDSFPPTNTITGNQSETWLYDVVAKTWIEQAGWLPEHTRGTIMRGGYYETLITPGLRLVSLNTNAGAMLNWWLQINATDPDGQLQWLVGVLQRAETAEEKVHIIGHQPPGEMMPVWSKNYALIVKRYESTIRGQFFGHTHKDQFQIFYDNPATRRPVSVAYVTAAITPQGGQYPGFRIYVVDGNYKNTTWAVLDHENYFMNLTDANISKIPKWQLEYTAKEAYRMTALQPSDWDRAVQEFKKERFIFDLYLVYFNRLDLYDTEQCDEACRTQMICDMQSAQGGDNSYC